MIYFVSYNDSMFDNDLYFRATVEDAINYCKSKDTLAVDTETTGLNFVRDDMTMFQIGDDTAFDHKKPKVIKILRQPLP